MARIFIRRRELMASRSWLFIPVHTKALSSCVKSGVEMRVGGLGSALSSSLAVTTKGLKSVVIVPLIRTRRSFRDGVCNASEISFAGARHKTQQ